TVDLINMNDLNPRIASAIETKSGPDIIMMISNWPHLYADGLADVDDVAEEIASRDGAYYEHNKKVSVVGNRWKAVPLCSVPSTKAGWPGTTAATTARTWPVRSRRRSTARASTSSPSGNSPTSPRSPVTPTCRRAQAAASTTSAARDVPS